MSQIDQKHEPKGIFRRESGIARAQSSWCRLPSVANPKNLRPELLSGTRIKRCAGWLGCGLIAAVFLWAVAQYYIPGWGVTMLLEVGDQFDAVTPSGLGSADYFRELHSPGYDGQFYAKIAVDPFLLHPESFRDQVDNLSYRGRRILPGWIAWALGGGEPNAVLRIYALENIGAWMGLGIILLHWFPPGSLNRFFRWVAVMMSCGLLLSVRSSLVDGPALFLLAAGVWALETRRFRLALLTFAAAALTRETSLLALLAWPIGEEGRLGFKAHARRIGLVILPLVGWLLYLRWKLGPASTGVDNFELPFAGFSRKWLSVIADISVTPWDAMAWLELSVMIGLTVQAAYFVLMRQFHSLWWRLGIVYALLMVFLGDAVWEGYPGAAPRVLLPLTLAFCVFIPRKSWLLLLLGNLSVLCAPSLFIPPLPELIMIRGNRDVRILADNHPAVEMKFGKGWHLMEWLEEKKLWRWSEGTADLLITNRAGEVITADVECDCRTIVSRNVSIRVNGEPVWEGIIGPDRARVHLEGINLRPGMNTCVFETAIGVTKGSDPRRLALKLERFYMVLRGRVSGLESR